MGFLIPIFELRRHAFITADTCGGTQPLHRLICSYFRLIGCILFGGLTWSGGSSVAAATITIQTNRIGATPSVIGYNLGHYYPGSNTRDWWRYSGVNGARIFISPGIIEPTDDIVGWGDGVTNQTSFLQRKNQLRSDPLNTTYIYWPMFENNFKLSAQHGSNLLNPQQACSELRQLGVGLLVCLTASTSDFPIADNSDWPGKWELWQHYYAEGFYFARNFDVERYQMYNEPNLSGTLTITDFLMRLQIISDAIQSAVADVNRMFGKNLTPQMYAPVAAGTAASTYSSWGRMVVTNRHTDFLGQVSSAFWLVKKYDYHEYNSTPSSFGNNLANLNNSMALDMNPEPRFPTSISEFNVHTAGTFDTLTETLDSPSQYSRLGSILVNLEKNFCDELYVFKFSQTLNSTTVKKNGAHFVDNTNAPYNIGGITAAGEVVRLFNKSEAIGRDRLSLGMGAGTSSLDVAASFDPISRNYHLFSASTTANVDLALDLSQLALPQGQRGILEEVSESSYGGTKMLVIVTNNQVPAVTQPSNTVWLFSIPSRTQNPMETFAATEDAMVVDGTNKISNFSSSTNLYVRNSSINTANRSAVFLKFHLPTYYTPDIQLAVLELRSATIAGASNSQAQVYGVTNLNWIRTNINWVSAPNLAQNVNAGIAYTNNYVQGLGDSANLLGQLVTGAAPADHFIDVTDFIRKDSKTDFAFLIARINRFYGDAQDDDGVAIVSNEADPSHGPRLLLIRSRDADSDGLSDEAEINVFGTNPNNPDTDGDGTTDGEEVLIYHTDPGSGALFPPSILIQPSGQSVPAGGSATFDVDVQGSPALHYQWYLNDTQTLTNATNSALLLSNVLPSQSGNYRVAITNTAGFAVSSNATLTVLPVNSPLPVAYDGFNYAIGSELASQGGWLLNGGTSGTIEAGNLSRNGLLASSGNRFTWGNPTMSVRLPIGTNLTSGEVYFSFLMRVDALGDFAASGTLAGFTTGTGTAFATKINIQTNGTGGFSLGVSKSTGTTYGAWAFDSFQVGQTILVVGRYHFNGGSGTDDLCDVWFDPPAGSFAASVPPPPSLANLGNGGNDLPQIDRFFFRSGGSSSSPAKLTADELRLGFTWASVTPPAPPPLRISKLGGNLLLAWPTNSAVFTLQTSTGLDSISWEDSTISPGISGTNYEVLIYPTNTASFFRLSR